MTDLSERTESTEQPDPPTAPDAHPAAGPPVIQFVPVEGERLEHLATERRGPVRWTASMVLVCQALVRKTPPPPSDPQVSPGGVVDAPAPGSGAQARSRAEGQAARRRRVQRAQRVRLARFAGGAAWLAIPAGRVSSGYAAAATGSPGRPGPAPMPGSGWAWNAEDEKSWEAWEASATGDTDHQLASLDSELERPLPAPVRWARLVGGRNGRSVAGRAERRRNPADDA
jgi:hypothetical protein